MKRSLFILTLFLTVCGVSTAAVTVEQVTEPEYVINSGYSETTAEEIQMMKSRTNGKPTEPLYQKNRNKFVNFCKNVYGYIDPASTTDDFYHHDIHQSPNWRDL